MSEIYYSASDLAEMFLPRLPKTRQNITVRAAAENWPCRPRSGRGGGYEYPVSALPLEAQEEIKRRATAQALALIPAPQLPAVTPAAKANDTEYQRLVADARKGVLAAIENMMQVRRCKLKTAARVLLDIAREEPNGQIARMLTLARDPRGCSSGDLPTVRSLQRLADRYQLNALAPRMPQANMSIPAWAECFLKHWQRPEKPSIEHAYRRFTSEWDASADNRITPSVHQVRRFIAKIGNVSREIGRMGPLELLSKKPYIRRDTSELWPCQIYTADGHKFDSEIQHPRHGRPVRPEVTSIQDIATRRIVGWSIGLAESALVVLDAIRHASVTTGIAAHFYVDNGSGYKNQMMTDEAVGLMGRLGMTMINRLPRRSQSGGNIEKLHQTIWVAAARDMPGYIGKDMDKEARQAMFKISRKAIKVMNEAVTMPLWTIERFTEYCAERAAEYNARPHRSLPKTNDPNTGRRRHMSPDEYWQWFVDQGFAPDRLAEDEARTLFRPRELRIVQRGNVSIFGNRYFSQDLEEFHGDQVAVAYEIQDPNQVWVYDDDGRLICCAQLNGNVRGFMPRSAQMVADEKRYQAKVKRLEKRSEEAYLELHGHRPLAHVDAVVLGARTIQVNELNYAEIVTEPEKIEWSVPGGGYEAAADRYEEFKRLSVLLESELPNDQAKQWLTTYPRTAEYRGFASLDDYFDEKKLNAPTRERRSA